MDGTYLQRFLNDSARAARRSEIRELLKLLARPEIISLAGGMPSPESFPIDEIAALLPAALRAHGATALQYGTTEGDSRLKAAILTWLVETEGPAFAGLTPEHVLITSASQQSLDLCGRVFVAPHDAIVVGLPTYLGALNAFSANGATLSGVKVDDAGLRTDLLEQRLVDLRRRGVHPKLLYVVPDFGNPTGVTLPRARREELLAIAREFDLLVIEDSPFRRLRFAGDDEPSLFELDRDGRVISLFSFSKILAPGLRLGWVLADPEVVARLVVAKQPVDVCTSGLSQLVAREVLAAGLLDRLIAKVRRSYSAKRDAMLEALDAEIDPGWGVRFTRPGGGMFLWLELPDGLDAHELLSRALAEEKVAFVPGRAFHCDGSGHNTLRLNFSYADAERITEAVRRLARCIGRVVAERGAAGPAGAAARESEERAGGVPVVEQLSFGLGLSEVVE